MIYFTKHDGGYRMFQTTVLYNTKAIYIWFEVFFFTEEQFKGFISFTNLDNNLLIRVRAIEKLKFKTNIIGTSVWPKFTKEEEKEIEVNGDLLREEIIKWYLKVGDLSNKSEFYNKMERMINPIVRTPTFHYYIHYNRRIKQIISFNEGRVSEARLKDLRSKCSKSGRQIRIKAILKSIWNDELEIDIAYKMLVES